MDGLYKRGEIEMQDYVKEKTKENKLEKLDESLGTIINIMFKFLIMVLMLCMAALLVIVVVLAKNVVKQDISIKQDVSIEQDLFNAAKLVQYEAWDFYTDKYGPKIKDFLNEEPYFDVSPTILRKTGLVGGWSVEEIENEEIKYRVYIFFMKDGHFFMLSNMMGNIFGYWTVEDGKIYVCDPDKEYHISEINYNKGASTLTWGKHIYKIESLNFHKK